MTSSVTTTGGEPSFASLAPTADALRRLVGLRYVVLALLALAVLAIRFVTGTTVPWFPLFAAMIALLLVNLFVQWSVSTRRSISEKELFANFVIEVLALTGVLYLVGGSTSPLATLYLLPLTVAANLMVRSHMWFLTLLTASCYSLLVMLNVPFDIHVAHGDDHSSEFGEHVLGHGIIFIASAALIAHYVASLAQSLRERDRELARAREEALRNERIVELGTLGAGAAHELGTPLATMSVLAEEWGGGIVRTPNWPRMSPICRTKLPIANAS